MPEFDSNSTIYRLRPSDLKPSLFALISWFPGVLTTLSKGQVKISGAKGCFFGSIGEIVG